MNTLIETVREIIGDPVFWRQLQNQNGSYSYNWDYGAMIEYMICGILLCIVVSSVFKFMRCLLK